MRVNPCEVFFGRKCKVEEYNISILHKIALVIGIVRYLIGGLVLVIKPVLVTRLPFQNKAIIGIKLDSITQAQAYIGQDFLLAIGSGIGACAKHRVTCQGGCYAITSEVN